GSGVSSPRRVARRNHRERQENGRRLAEDPRGSHGPRGFDPTDRMKNGPECIPCCLRRILQVSRLVTADEWLHRKILDEAMPELARVDELSSPAEVVHAAFKRAAKTLGDPDPFAPEKRRWVEETVGNIELFRESIQASPD